MQLLLWGRDRSCSTVLTLHKCCLCSGCLLYHPGCCFLSEGVWINGFSCASKSAQPSRHSLAKTHPALSLQAPKPRECTDVLLALSPLFLPCIKYPFPYGEGSHDVLLWLWGQCTSLLMMWGRAGHLCITSVRSVLPISMNHPQPWPSQPISMTLCVCVMPLNTCNAPEALQPLSDIPLTESWAYLVKM